jgi:hypothetical protein
VQLRDYWYKVVVKAARRCLAVKLLLRLKIFVHILVVVPGYSKKKLKFKLKDLVVRATRMIGYDCAT